MFIQELLESRNTMDFIFKKVGPEMIWKRAVQAAFRVAVTYSDRAYSRSAATHYEVFFEYNPSENEERFIEFLKQEGIGNTGYKDDLDLAYKISYEQLLGSESNNAMKEEQVIQAFCDVLNSYGLRCNPKRIYQREGIDESR